VNKTRANGALSCWLGKHADEHSVLDALALHPIFWLNGQGDQGEIIISSRVRLARNLSKYFFRSRIESAELFSVLESVSLAARRVPELKGLVSLNMDKLSAFEKALLMERRLISPNFARSDRPGNVIIGPGELASMMINEEDHLRIQVMQPALGLHQAWEVISTIDDHLSKHVDYAFSEQFGYLTACPTNAGTGLRASIFVHLPALVATGKIPNILKNLGPSEVAFRGFYGEGTRMLGDIYQVSNQLTLGRAEERIIERMYNVTLELTELEQRERKKLLRKDPILIQDRVARAIAIMQAAKMLESKELLQLLSDLRLGSSLGVIEPIDHVLFNELVVTTQPAHLQKMLQREMDIRERDVARAEYVKQRLSQTRSMQIFRSQG
jgi:protein arginine kinase